MKGKKKPAIYALALLFALAVFLPIANSAQAAANHGTDAYNYVKYLDENLRERIAGTNQEQKAANYIKQELESFGYQTTVTPFTYTRKNQDYNSQNISVIKKGRSSKKIIVGAHYDSVGTAGVDDNGSGVAVTLETAKKFIHIDTPYTIEFVFFGAEEVGLKGSKAYVDNMTAEEKQNTILMVNLDSILAGTYTYIYGGTVQSDGTVANTFAVDQAKNLSNQLQLGLRLNNTAINYDYPSPSTGSWSDHASFANAGIPYLYLEAANWELPDNPSKPEEGSSGAYETESGPVMHKMGRDDLTFIEQEWGSRAKDTLKTYATFLYHYLPSVSPNGLLANKTQLQETVKKAEKLTLTKYTKKSVAAFQKALQEAKTIVNDDTIAIANQNKVDKANTDLLTAQNKLTLFSNSQNNEQTENSTGNSNTSGNTNGTTQNATTAPQTSDSNTTTIFLLTLMGSAVYIRKKLLC